MVRYTGSNGQIVYPHRHHATHPVHKQQTLPGKVQEVKVRRHKKGTGIKQSVPKVKGMAVL